MTPNGADKPAPSVVFVFPEHICRRDKPLVEHPRYLPLARWTGRWVRLVHPVHYVEVSAFWAVERVNRHLHRSLLWLWRWSLRPWRLSRHWRWPTGLHLLHRHLLLHLLLSLHLHRYATEILHQLLVRIHGFR